jgi:hypothetical protein
VPFSEALELLGGIFELLEPGGVLIMSTPNVAHPTHYFRDPTHVRPYSHEGLGGMLVALGFEVKAMCRIYNAPFVQKILRKYVLSALHRLVGIDYAHSLVTVARRPMTDKTGTGSPSRDGTVRET